MGDRHFWFRARNQVITTLTHQIIAGLAPGYRVLEVGCGTGNVLRVLEQVCAQGMVVGMDLSPRFAKAARKFYGLDVIVGDLQRVTLRRIILI